jgi:hypothetical protein
MFAALLQGGWALSCNLALLQLENFHLELKNVSTLSQCLLDFF